MKITAKVFATLSLLVLAASPAFADIEKYAQTCGNRLCFYWWPHLEKIDGWAQDIQASYEYSANALAPEGSSFHDAPAVLYASAIYKPRVPKVTSRDKFISADQARFSKEDPGITIAQETPEKTADGQRIVVFSFSPSKGDGQWELVGYGEETEYYLTFTLSARTQQALQAARPAFRKMISQYREKP